MPQDYASSLKFGLQDLMAGDGGGYAPPPQAPQVPGSPDPLEAQRAALLAQLMQPDPTVPDKEAPKRNMLASILMGLGDAGTAYASVIGNAPGIKTDTLGNYMAYLTQQKDSADRFNERKKLGDAESKRRNVIVGLDETQRALEAKAAKIAEGKADRALQDKIKRDQDAEVSRRQFELDKMAQDHALDQQEQGARFKHEEGMKRLEASLKTGDDPKAEKALQAFSLGSRIANTIVRGLPESKDGPAVPPLSVLLTGDKENGVAPRTPDEIRRQFEDEMTQEGIFGPPRDLARDYFNERLIRTYRETQKAAQPQNLGP